MAVTVDTEIATARAVSGTEVAVSGTSRREEAVMAVPPPADPVAALAVVGADAPSAGGKVKGGGHPVFFQHD
jgi:hypothetical protein